MIVVLGRYKNYHNWAVKSQLTKIGRGENVFGGDNDSVDV
jgi:hypothetical protein